MLPHVIFKNIRSRTRDKGACNDSRRVKILELCVALAIRRRRGWRWRLCIRLRRRLYKPGVSCFLFRPIGEVNHRHVMLTCPSYKSRARLSDPFECVKRSINSWSRVQAFCNAYSVFYSTCCSLFTVTSLASFPLSSRWRNGTYLCSVRQHGMRSITKQYGATGGASPSFQGGEIGEFPNVGRFGCQV